MKTARKTTENLIDDRPLGISSKMCPFLMIMDDTKDLRFYSQPQRTLFLQIYLIISLCAQCVIFENKATLPFLMPADFTACPKTADRPDLPLLALRRY